MSFNFWNFYGGLLSCQVPHLVIIAFGYYFSTIKIITKDGIHAFSKLIISTFLPIYLFLNVCRSTSASLIAANYLQIISGLFQILVSVIIGGVYILFTKMDVRYRYAWLVLNSLSL